VQRFWDEFLLPVARGCEAKVICEIGSEFGGLTRRLLDYCVEEGAVAHVIDPQPQFDVEAWREEYGDALVFHRQLSLEVLGTIPAPDLVLIDGDHNWYTVVNELRLLEGRVEGDDGALPVIALHDIEWPYGHRDLYYDPGTIPAEHRQKYEQRGIHPDDESLTDEGINGHLCNAAHEGGEHNGVMTAVEDFLAKSATRWTVETVPGFHGLGLLVPVARLKREPSLEQAVARWRHPEALRGHVQALEESRIAEELRHVKAREEAGTAKVAAEAARVAAEAARVAAEAARASHQELVDKLERSQSRERARLTKELDKLRRSQSRERARLRKELQVIAGSPTWRVGHFLASSFRVLTRRSRREGDKDALKVLIDRLRSLERSQEAVTAGKREQTELKALRTERELATAFSRRYAVVISTALDVGAAKGPTEAVPVDRRGVLAAPDDRPDGRPSAAVVVCVHDALGDLRRCLRSLLTKTGRPFHLILVDDGSGPEARDFLRRFSDQNPATTLVTREGPPHGYTLAANEGLRASSADYVVLLNSDTVVTVGWLDRLVECGESDRSLGIVGPLSNAASYQSVPRLREGGGWAVNALPPFLTPDGLAYLLSEAAPRSCPRLPFLNGFCYAIKRGVIDTIGVFDEENFASGYCEENDFSYRASQEGFELAVADSAYVFHAKSRSYGQEGRRDLARCNYQLFTAKHGEENIGRLVESLERDTSLEPLRELVAEATADAASFIRAFQRAHPSPLRVAFVLYSVPYRAAGGVHSIYQETRGMRTLGIDAKILVPANGLDHARHHYADADEVFVAYAGEQDLFDRTADREVIVATHFRSVALLRGLRERRGDFLPAYYVQDYEPFFHGERSEAGVEALASYGAIPDQLLFAKTQWLCELIGRIHDRPVAKVEPSIDHEVYRPLAGRRPDGQGKVRIVGMVRPGTPRRQALGTLRILDRVQTELGSQVDVTVFGVEPEKLRDLAPTRAPRIKNVGLLTREQVAETLAQSDVFLDFSTYQAFGRTALEAMACGCVAVVPQIGGVDEYAVHGENSFVVDTSNEDDAFEAVVDLVADPKRLSRMSRKAAETAARFSVLRAALSEYLLFADEYRRRRDGRGPPGGGANDAATWGKGPHNGDDRAPAGSSQ